MCGLAGVICLEAGCRAEEHAPLVARMCSLQRHRGPDDEGVHAVGNACLGSNRLSIIDLTAAGHMPMSDETGDWWIAYNGEIYNFADIRKELESLGHEFASRTDTEVVLRAFKQWGEDALERFAGMFAFALYDRAADTLTLARDRFGKKPLYYSRRGDHLVFASELKALLRTADRPRLNRQRLIEWSFYRNVDFGSPATLVEDVLSLPAGHVMTVRRGVVEAPRPYYVPEREVDAELFERHRGASEESVIDELAAQLDRAVRERLVSDVPVGTLCSGGVDSSLISALCARHLDDLAAFNVSVTGYEDLDESRYARRVAGDLGIELFIYSMTAEGFRSALPRAIHHGDVPLTHPNSVAYLLVSELAREHGRIILMSGEAADELFGGYMHRYRRYRQLRRAQRVLARLPGKLRQIIALCGHAINDVPATSLPRYGAGLAASTAFLDNFVRRELRRRCEDAYGFVSDEGDRGVLGAMLADLTDFLSPLLRRLDRMSMAASVESRVPFLDHRLVKTAVNLPLSFRLRGRTDKWALKQIASRYLPPDIVHRKKLGFPLPLADYLAPLARRDLFEDGFCIDFLGMNPDGFLASVDAWRSDPESFFTLLSLELWGRMFFLDQSLDDVTAAIRCQSFSSRPAPRPR